MGSKIKLFHLALLENFRCVNWRQRFSGAFVFRDCVLFFLHRFCICSAFGYLVVLCVYAARLLNAAHVLLNEFLNLLVFCLFAYV